MATRKIAVVNTSAGRGEPRVRSEERVITPEEEAANARDLATYREATLRSERLSRLSSCDWTQLPDSPLKPAQRASWAAYRRILRDRPTGPWPEEPT